jgi:23S rRNA (pseudouridine1915-N3)-methyltransferase
VRIRVVAVGTRSPGWVDTAFADYAARLGPRNPLTLTALAPAQRTASRPAAQAIADEGRRILETLRADEYVVALDERGRELSTRELAEWLQSRRNDGRDVALVIGGADGLAPEVLQRADQKLSLSRLTFPHALVRVIVAEQVYRAHSLLANHPYHRD